MADRIGACDHRIMDVRAAAVGSVAFFFLAPAVVGGVIPAWIGNETQTSTAWPLRSLGAVVALGGLALLVVCFADFVRARGTPAPVAPTERLVVNGPFRYVRNPMYVAVVAVILGQSLWWGSVWVLGYALLMWVVFAGFVRVYEEPTLRAQFGSDYEIYRVEVRAWVPRLSPYAAAKPR